MSELCSLSGRVRWWTFSNFINSTPKTWIVPEHLGRFTGAQWKGPGSRGDRSKNMRLRMFELWYPMIRLRFFLPYQHMSKYSLTPWNCKTKQLQQHLIEGPKSAIDSGLCSALPQTVINLQEIRWFSMVIIYGIYASQLSSMVKSMQVPWCDHMAGILRWAVLVLFASFPCSPLVKTRTVGKVLF